jgi:hypothetical protein
MTAASIAATAVEHHYVLALSLTSAWIAIEGAVRHVRNRQAGR